MWQQELASPRAKKLFTNTVRIWTHCARLKGWWWKTCGSRTVTKLNGCGWCIRDHEGISSVVRFGICLTRDTAQDMGDPASRRRGGNLWFLPWSRRNRLCRNAALDVCTFVIGFVTTSSSRSYSDTRIVLAKRCKHL